MNESVKKLITYALEHSLIKESDRVFMTNRILEVIGADSYEEPKEEYGEINLEEVLSSLMDYAAESGALKENDATHRDLFDTKIMSVLVQRPSEIIEKFNFLYEQSPEKATDFYYNFSQDTNYIRRDRIKRDVKWVTGTEYGDLDITINLSKPEKDPKAIAAAKLLPQSGYPKCQLCRENEGYAGRINHPARQNHRIIPVTIDGSPWGFQYSPYVYYNEHCIVFNSKHVPMKIDESAFRKLFDFVKLFPHYFVGSNADLPIVGGSILSHEHFQGGRYEFAMAKAPIEKEYVIPGFEDMTCGRVKWPMSVIRLRSASSERLVALGSKILAAWRDYTDEKCFIFARTGSEPHNTVTPIARQKDGIFELDLVLRNNITTDEHPLGVFHPHAEIHNIKKENIGLIEVMGLAVLPSRLKNEMALLKKAVLNGENFENDETIGKHFAWFNSFSGNYTFTEENITDILHNEIGKTFSKALEHAGVFKRDENGMAGFDRFISSLK
ncbi:MAG: UDP-glucose--hexose-1-phosphate uridylyltransferase [Acutalibacteraceae bacterium]